MSTEDWDRLAQEIYKVLVNDLDCDGYAAGYADGLASWARGRGLPVVARALNLYTQAQINEIVEAHMC